MVRAPLIWLQRLSFLFLFLLPTLAFAQQSRIANILINADNTFRDIDRKVIELSGNVQVVFQNQHLKCDRAVIYLETQTVEAFGSVSIVTQSSTMEGERIVMNYKTGLGTIYDGAVYSGQVIFEGKLIHKTGDDEFTAIDAYYSACDTCPGAWSFTGGKIDAQIGGYAHITNPFLKVADFPVFWLPYLVVPLKSSRQTGFLFPTFNVASELGLTIGESFFWAISRSQDATLTLKMNHLQTKGLFNYRYILNKESRGELDAIYMKDKFVTFSNEEGVENINIFRPSHAQQSALKRWYIKYNHYYALPQNWIHRTQLNLTGDLRYPNRYSQEETKTQKDAALENRVSLTKNTFSQHMSLDTDYYINLLKENPFSNNRDAVHRFPEIRYSLTETKVNDTNLLFKFDLDYTHFARGEKTFDDLCESSTTGETIVADPSICINNDLDGISQFSWDKDQIRAGQRVLFEPSLSYPLHFDRFLDILPSLTYRDANYKFSVDDRSDLRRQTLRAQISAKTTLSRVYTSHSGTKYKHEIQPEITHTWIPWIQVDDARHPFFAGRQNTGDSTDTPFFKTDQGITDDDVFGRTGLQFDNYDRLFDRNLITLSLTNHFIRKTNTNYKRFVSLILTETFDAHEASLNKPDKKPWSDIEALLRIQLDRFETYAVFNYYPYHSFTETSARFRYRYYKSNYVGLSISQDFNISDSIHVDYKGRTEEYTFLKGFFTKYFDLRGQVIYSSTLNKVKKYNFKTYFKLPGNCWKFDIALNKEIDHDPTFGFNMQFSWDGKSFQNLALNKE